MQTIIEINIDNDKLRDIRKALSQAVYHYHNLATKQESQYFVAGNPSEARKTSQALNYLLNRLDETEAFRSF